MNTKEAFSYISKQLSSRDVDNAKIESRILLCHTLNQSPAALFSNPEYKLSDAEIEHLIESLERRSRGEPIPYIFNSCEFYGLNFYVDNNVLIPRPETELLVEAALEYCKNLYANKALNPNIKIADIGTGSGAVAISIAKNAARVIIYATDISSRALDIARYNCMYHSVSDRIHLIKCNLLDFVTGDLNLVVANLPYVASSDLNTPDSGLAYEPRIALNGGRDGIEIIQRFLEACKSKLKRNCTVLLEIGYNHDSKVKELISTIFKDRDCSFIKDYSGYNRIAKIAF